MKTLQLILITLTVLASCSSIAKNTATGTVSINANEKIMTDSLTYLALGDSYTIGESVEQNESFPYQLRNLLNNQSLKVAAPDIIAVTGWTTDDLITAISGSKLTKKKYDFVTLLIGVNDQYQGLDQSNYRIKFIEVLHTAIKFANGNAGKVFVLSIPDWGVTPYANGQDKVIAPQIDQFNAINKAESLKAGVHYVDITPASRQAAADTGLVAPDGLHPSAAMYAAWVKLLEPIVEKKIKK